MEQIEKSMNDELQPEYRLVYKDSTKSQSNAVTVHASLQSVIFGLIMKTPSIENATIESTIPSQLVSQTIGKRDIWKKRLIKKDNGKKILIKSDEIIDRVLSDFAN